MRIAFAAAVLTSAFLLFLVQPLIGRTILPWFGAATGVWTACMLFFQVMLLAGYACAHVAVTRLGGRGQVLLQCALVGAAVAALPITPPASARPLGADAPTRDVLEVLSTSVGLPYLALASTSPLLLVWAARVGMAPRSAYRLYAVSNAGSLLALAAYPFLLEPGLTVRAQTSTWSWGFCGFAGLLAICAALTWRSAAPQERVDESRSPGARPSRGAVLHWIALAAAASALLLATTNQLCLDLAVVPLLWVLPLAVYLLTFVVSFAGWPGHSPTLWLAILAVALLAAVGLLEGSFHASLVEQVLGTTLVLAAGCMCCHGELARRRPHSDHLTGFFLAVAFGGAAGGACVALLAPRVLPGFYEYHICLVAVALLAAGAALSQATPVDARARAGRAICWCITAGAAAWGGWRYFQPGTWVDPDGPAELRAQLGEWLEGSRTVGGVVLAAILVVALAVRARRRGWQTSARGGLATLGGAVVVGAGILLLAGSLLWLEHADSRRAIARARNFYGTLTLAEYEPGLPDHRLSLLHGRIRHGSQLLRHPSWPTTYYGPLTGGGFAIQHHPRRQEPARQYRVGIVGLGAGTLAAYANAWVDPEWPLGDYAVRIEWDPADHVVFYELNPLVTRWAAEKFSYVGDARARGASVEVFAGDARLVMERQLERGQRQEFDVLVLDAFSSDAIPVHLLTLESFRVYWRHLQPDGILAIHVSNRFVDLVPVCRRLALELGHDLVHLANDRDDEHGVSKSQWLLVTSNRTFLDEVLPPGAGATLPPPGPLWTDDYSSIFELLR